MKKKTIGTWEEEVISLKCPYCNEELTYETTEQTLKERETRWYCCLPCEKRYERHILRNNMGLIQEDTLFEIDLEGTYKNYWK
jgi:hypothetical protein